MSFKTRIAAFIDRKLIEFGRPFAVFRSVNSANPLDASLGSTLAYPYRNPKGHGDADWFLMVGEQLAQVGDYLVNGDEVYIYALAPFLLPGQAIRCNRKVALLGQPAPASAVGAQPYGGVCVADSVAVLGAVDAAGVLVTGWPCSILIGGRTEKGGSLPMSTKDAGWQVMLPRALPVELSANSIFLDDLGRRYIIEAAELSELGWRCNVKEVHP
jgi:hypothetical protein